MKAKISAFVLLLLLLPLELYLSSKAYYTISETSSILFWIISLVFSALAILFIIMNKLKSALLYFAVGYLLVVPFNIYLWHELDQLKEESNNIIHSLIKDKELNGFYTDTLEQARDNRINYVVNNEEFEISFFVYSENTRHSYKSTLGWSYYPD